MTDSQNKEKVEPALGRGNFQTVLKAIVERSDTRAGRTFDLVIQGLIILSILSFSVETLPNLSAKVQATLYLIETVTVAGSDDEDTVTRSGGKPPWEAFDPDSGATWPLETRRTYSVGRQSHCDIVLWVSSSWPRSGRVRQRSSP